MSKSTMKNKEYKLQQLNNYLPLMDDLFADLYESFKKQPLVTRASLPKAPGIYVFYRDGEPIYVGRTDNIRKRIYQHTMPSSGQQSANFAFNLTVMEFVEKAQGAQISRSTISLWPEFIKRFSIHKMNLYASRIKYITIENDVIQTMFEPYLALKLGTYPLYNNFENH